jgi:hypothetical protein
VTSYPLAVDVDLLDRACIERCVGALGLRNLFARIDPEDPQ